MIALPGGNLESLDLEGAPPALVLLHEGLGSVGLWRDFPARLGNATARRVVAFSRYGHGQSDPPLKPRTPKFMHEEAFEVLPQVLDSIGPVVLVGHSDGASIALLYAARHPVEGVVAIAPHVFVEPMCLEEIRNAKHVYEHHDLKRRMARHHRDPDAAFYGWNDVWLDPEFPTWDIRPELQAITAPLLLIQGTQDQYGTLAQLDEIERNTSAPVKRVHVDAQHAPHHERPAETLDAIDRFVTGLPSGGT
jgi:pimeloyl-ACP methyl ester carboxylesterase